jgi:adhesin transport system membrane fusion protein
MKPNSLNGNKPARVSSHVFLSLCSISLGMFIVWAYLGQIDIVTVAQGVVVPATKIKTVQHLEGGIIQTINVREGDRVKKGEALVELEGLVSSANLKELEVRLTSLRIDLVRLKAELGGAEYLEFETDLKENHSDLISAAIERFNTRRSHIRNLISAQGHSVKQREEEVREINARITKNTDSLKYVEEQVSISDELMRENLTNRMLHLNLLKERTLIGGALNEDAAAINRIKAAKREAQVRLSTLHDNYLIETRVEYDDIYPLYLELSQRRKKLIDSLKRTVLRAPVDGFIKVLYHSTVGGVVRPGDTVIDLVPKGDRLLVEVQLPVQEVVFISVGQVSTVRLAIAGTEKFGQLQGRVVHISPDSIRLADETPFYIVKIELNGDHFESKGKKYPLLPGVQVTCSITTGKRSVLEYVLEPFLSIKHTAFQER